MKAKSVLIHLSYFTVGLVAGFAGGYFFSKNKFRSIADKEIDSVRKVYDKRLAEYISKEYKDPSEEKTENLSKDNAKDSDEVDDLGVKENDKKKIKIKEKPFIDYQKFYSGNKENEKRPPVEEKPSIYAINLYDFNNSTYNSESLYYYKFDRVLVDSDENVIRNPSELIGDDALEVLEEYSKSSNEPLTMYVRNERYKTDYEIRYILARLYDVEEDLEEDQSLYPREEDDDDDGE